MKSQKRTQGEEHDQLPLANDIVSRAPGRKQNPPQPRAPKSRTGKPLDRTQSLEKIPPSLEAIWKELVGLYVFEGELGIGRNGATYIIQELSTENRFCLKTIRLNAPDPERAADSLRKEIEILPKLNHQCIPFVIRSNRQPHHPYYICKYHPGTTLADFASKYPEHRFSFSDSLYIVSALLDTIIYLHEMGISHCDLHAKNVMLSKEVLRDGILVIDFGSGHDVDSPASQTPNRGAVGERALYPSIRTRAVVPKELANPSFYDADFSQLASLLSIADEILFTDISEHQRREQIAFQSYLRSGAVTPQKAREHILRIADPGYRYHKFERAYESDSSSRRTIPLPISNIVRVGDRHLKLINTKTFQRLRNLKQLSFCDWYFPGANHTRFEHSLGVFELLRHALRHLSDEDAFRDHTSVEEMHCVALSGLLHDLGHYPFAHSIEQYAAVRFPEDSATKSFVSHGQYSRELIQSADLRNAITDIAGQNGVELILSILDGEKGILSELIDGPFDCDKIDYLRRDAHHCGIQFGAGMDAMRLLKSYACRRNGTQSILAVKEAEISAVTGFAILQDQMLSGVYWHPLVRGIHAMFHQFLDAVISPEGAETEDGQEFRSKRLKEVVSSIRECATEAEAVTKVLLPRLEARTDLIAAKKEFAKSLIALHAEPDYRSLFFPIASYHVDDRSEPGFQTSIYKYLVKPAGSTMKAGKLYGELDVENSRNLATAFAKAFLNVGVALDVERVIIDIPKGKTKHKSIEIVNEDGSVKLLENSTHIKPSLLSNPTAFNGPVRVYIPRDVYDGSKAKLPIIRTDAIERFKDLISDDLRRRQS